MRTPTWTSLSYSHHQPHRATPITVERTYRNMSGPQAPTLETIPLEIRLKIIQEVASSKEFQLGPGGSRDVANILHTSRRMRQDGLRAFNFCCTISYTQGPHIPYLPRYFRTDLIRQVAIYLPKSSWAPTPPVTAMFPSLREFKLVYEPELLISMPDSISKLAHQMASLSPSKKACISFILYMMDHPTIRPTMVLEPPTDDPRWADYGSTLYEIPFTASLGFHSNQANPQVSGVSLACRYLTRTC